MSKAHDDPSRASKDPTRGAAKAVGGDAKKVVADGATPRRVRSAGPRERSGPIGISSGDFSTPLVRKRTTTQPRGVPAVGAKAPASSLDEPVSAATADDSAEFEEQPTPAPETTDMGVVGAMPSNPVDAIPVAMPVPPAASAGRRRPVRGRRARPRGHRCRSGRPCGRSSGGPGARFGPADAAAGDSCHRRPRRQWNRRRRNRRRRRLRP